MQTVISMNHCVQKKRKRALNYLPKQANICIGTSLVHSSTGSQVVLKFSNAYLFIENALH